MPAAINNTGGQEDRVGDAGDALDFALDHIGDPFERTDFLEGWREGDLSEWPEYSQWLQTQRDGAAEARTCPR